jgi:hypothetical protein
MSESWSSKLRDREAGWPSDDDMRPSTAAYDQYVPEENVAAPRRRWAGWLLRGVFALAAVAWLGIVGWSFADPTIGVRLAPFLEIVSRLSIPLVLVVGLALFVMMLAGHWDNDDAPAKGITEDARDLAAQTAQAAARISDAHAQLLTQTRGYATAADRSATALLDAVQQMTERSEQLDRATASSIQTLAALSERMDKFESATPHLEQRISVLAETLACLGVELRERSTYLETRLQDAASAAQETRVQLMAAGDSLNDRLAGLRDGARVAGEELASLSELSSARIDFTLDRVRTVLDSTEQRIDAQNQALTQLVERSHLSMQQASQHALTGFQERCEGIEATLDRLDGRIVQQSEKGGAWLEAASAGATMLARQFDALEQSAIARTERLAAAMAGLSGETRQLADSLDAGDRSSEQLIKRTEALLLALDSSVRELDESVPSAITRVEERLTAMRQRISDAGPGIESIEAVASSVAGQMEEAGKLSAEQVARLDAALLRSQAALAEQKAQVIALAEAIDKAGDGMAQLGEKVGPHMVDQLSRVRDTADAAARKAHQAIMEVIPKAASALGDASSGAMQLAATASVDAQVERLTQTANHAVKAASDAAASLEVQLQALHAASNALERRISGSSLQIEAQDRELLTRRSGELIEMLNSRAIDVSKWLGHDISEGEWSAYLKGDQGLFARRAVRMLSRTDTKAIHTLYRDDVDFAEHVNRYVHDFETLLRSVLAARDGSALAVTMLSSDLGKLYVALAQGSDRLRS